MSKSFLLLYFLALIVVVVHVEVHGCAPVESAVIDRMIYHFPSASCYGRPSGEPVTIVHIKSDAVLFSPPFQFSNNSACPAQIASMFRARHPELRYRPVVSPRYFVRRAPRAYAQYQSTGWADFPCSIVPVLKITPWNGGRRLFARLIRIAVRGIVEVRDYRCNRTIHFGDALHLEQFLMRQKVANAAINYLLGIAYASQYCINL